MNTETIKKIFKTINEGGYRETNVTEFLKQTENCFPREKLQNELTRLETMPFSALCDECDQWLSGMLITAQEGEQLAEDLRELFKNCTVKSRFEIALQKLVESGTEEITISEFSNFYEEIKSFCKTETEGGDNADTTLYDWLEAGDYRGDETPESLAEEWDDLGENE